MHRNMQIYLLFLPNIRIQMYLYVIHLCIDYKDVLYKIYLLLNLFVEDRTVYENY